MSQPDPDIRPDGRSVLDDVASRVWPSTAWAADRDLVGMSNENWHVRLGADTVPTYFVQQLAHADKAEELGVDPEIVAIARRVAVAQGILPEPVASFADLRVVVSPFIPHAVPFPAPGADRGSQIDTVADIFHGFHTSDFPDEVLSQEVPSVVEDLDTQLRELIDEGLPVPDGLDVCLDHLAHVRAALPRVANTVIHFDPRPENFLVADRIYLIDWEYARIADPAYDLGSFAFFNRLSQKDELRLVRRYAGSHDSAVLDRLRLYRCAAALVEVLFGIYMNVTVGNELFDYAKYAVDNLAIAKATAESPEFTESLRRCHLLAGLVD